MHCQNSMYTITDNVTIPHSIKLFVVIQCLRGHTYALMTLIPPNDAISVAHNVKVKTCVLHVIHVM